MFRTTSTRLIGRRKALSLCGMPRQITFQRFSRKLSQMSWLGLVLTFSMAQETGDLIVVSEAGEAFRLYLNGEWILDQPGTRAEVHDLHEGFHKGTVYIYPSEGRAIQLKKTFAVEGGYVEYYAIRKNRKGQYTITIYNRVLKEEMPLPPPPPSVWGPTQPPHTQPSFPVQPSPGVPASSGGQVQTNTQNQTVIFNPTIQIQTGGGGTQVTGQNTGTGMPTTPPMPVYTGPTYTGPCNCQQPMSRNAFQRALSTLQSQTFDNTRLDLAKNIARNNCLLASDVKALTATFEFENNKLEFARFAYDYTLDVSNYFEVAEALDYEHSRTELMEYAGRRGARYTCSNIRLTPELIGDPGPGVPAPSGPGNPVSPSPNPAPCRPCMAPDAFASALRTIQNTASDMTRLEVAKSLLVSNCLSAQQVRDICRAFASESNRLEFAKAAYRRCCDPGNYIIVADAFASTLSREELARYIQTVGR